MKKEILIFRYFPTEGPGYFAEFLDRHAIRHRTIKVDQGEPIPESIADMPGLVFMGGPMSVNDRLPWIPKLLRLIRQAVAADIPVLGHCLGSQLISKALGGRVRRHRLKEIGWLPVQPVAQTPVGLSLPAKFEVFHWHGETFSLPPGATHILRSRHCRNQGFVIGKSLALQCHIEMTADMVRSWARVGAREIAAAQPTVAVQQVARLMQGVDARTKRLHRIADIFYTHWIKGLER